MRKRVLARGNIHRSDYLRALVSDATPGDIPIIISNDGFYKNVKARVTRNIHAEQFVDALLKPPGTYTVPYRYNILRADGSSRRLSLTHPSAQIAVAEFYQKYGNLICYYCRKSPASIRSPEKVGSLFFVRGSMSEKNKLKGQGIDTVSIELSVSNPASYFSYRGHDRAFKFFNSSEYVRLEKRYTVMYFADVSKCFGSIYTHTLFWATADLQTAKDNTSALSFSNAFDRLMQSMNFNETNGICVGAEVSRIFAELLLSEVDKRAIDRLNQQHLHYRVHYEFKRYVDDYYVFCENEKTARSVLAAIRLALADFNLHLNEQKTQEIKRPFITKKSRLVRESGQSLEAFFSRFIGAGSEGGVYSYPKKIRRAGPLLRSLLDSIKSGCFDHESGYEVTSNYVIGALASRVTTLVDDFDTAMSKEEVTHEDYVAVIMLLLEAIYFFYNVNPTVPSSLRVAQAAIRAANFFDKQVPDRSAFLAEQVVRWTFQFVKSLRGSTIHAEGDCVPLEALNILLVLGEVGRNEALTQEVIHEFAGSVKALHYFEIVSFLFCIQDESEFASLRASLFQRSKEILLSGLGVRVDAHAAHLALDLLTCPYIDIDNRASLFNDLRQRVDLGALSRVEAVEAVRAFENDPWFVNWRGTDLLRMIRKKELSGVY
jgi:uncharacterized membrane protein (UPF0136 family)